MFDNLREDANSVPFYEDEARFDEVQKPSSPKRPQEPRRAAAPASRRLLGMTSAQRFILAIMLFFAVCALGSMCLLITGKIGF